MIKCLNLNMPEIQAELQKLSDVLGNANAAYAVLALNNGFGLEQAPNGQVSKLFQNIYDNIRNKHPEMEDDQLLKKVILEKAKCYSPNFFNWFGDWINDPENSSKVVDENGEPMIVYHGISKEDTNEFRTNNGWLHGIYFSKNKKIAEAYAKDNIIKPVFLNVRNLKEIPSEKALDAITLNGNIVPLELAFKMQTEEVVPIIKEHYDGVTMYTQGGLDHEIVVYSPNQVKSAIANNGEFRLDTNNIYTEHITHIPYKTSENTYQDTLLYDLYNNHYPREDGSVIMPIGDVVSSVYSLNRSHVPTVFKMMAHLRQGKPSILKGISVVIQPDELYKQNNISARSFYDAGTKTIYINRDAYFNSGVADEVILHELLHAITVDRVYSDPVLAARFQTVLDEYKAKYIYDPRYDGEHALEEFIANIWSDPVTIHNLRSTKSPRKANWSLWQEIKDIISNVFYDLFGGTSAYDTLFAEASTLMMELLDQQSQDIAPDLYTDTTTATLSNDTKDILALQQYQYTLERLTAEEIKERQLAYLQGDADEVRRVRRMVDQVQIRQAQLHTLGRDFGKETRINGYFNWNEYLKGIDLRHDISEEDNLSVFPTISDYTVDPAEIIMPKLYRTQFKLGTKDIADIDVNYFKKVNPYYNTHLKDKDGNGPKIDVLVRTHTSAFNIIISDSLTAPTENMTLVHPRIENGWRLNDHGDRMYKIPEGLNYMIYCDSTGQETICIQQSEHAEKQARALIATTQNLVSLQLFAENIEPTEDWLSFTVQTNNIKTSNSSLNKLLYSGLTSDQIRDELKRIYKEQAFRYKEDLAQTLYNSFVRSLQMISVRIPTQAFQSIMAVKVAGLTNDDSNNVFVTRWQFWLQGSDLDIDKTYLMGVDISAIGQYNHWSPLADYTSEAKSKLSDQLPLPNQKVLVRPENVYKHEEQPILIEFSQEPTEVNRLITEYLNNEELDRNEAKLSTIVALLKHINKTQTFLIDPVLYEDKRVRQLISLINKHNTHEVTAAEARNIIQKNIIQASLDERNMKASYSPIDVVMQRFKDELDGITDFTAAERHLDDGGLSIARMQYNNSVGKKDVGVMANGLKAFFALTQYFNKHRKDADFVKSQRYFLSRISLAPGDNKYFSTISDVRFEQEALKQLKSAFKLYLGTELSDDLTFTADDASLLISSLVSLATDNAKELALAKMNASIDLACMHLFLVVMGYNPKEIISFTTSPAFNKVVDVLNNSVLAGTKLDVRSAIQLVKSRGDITDEERYSLNQMLFIYNCAQEMSKVAKLAGINQGVKVDEIEADKFYTTIQGIVLEQARLICPGGENNLNLSINNSGLISLSYVSVITDDITKQKVEVPLSEDEVVIKFLVATHNYDPATITPALIQEYKQKLASLNARNTQFKYVDESFQIDMLRYFRDSDYRQFIIDLYDLFKHNFNVLDCIAELPHFNKMLEAFVLAENTIKKHSSRARAVLDQAQKAYQSRRIYNKVPKWEDDGSESGRTKHITVFEKQSFGKPVQNKAGKFYDDYILSEWIHEHGKEYTIKYKDNNKSYTIDVTNNKGVADFANFMAYELIPLLKEVLPKNTFLKYIKPDFQKLRKGKVELFLPKYVFNFDVDTLLSVSDQNKAFYINKGFEELSQIRLNSPLLSELGITEGGDITLGELFYLYDKLTAASSVGQGTLDRAFETYLAKQLEAGNETIASQIAQIELDHDLGTRPEVVFDPMLFTAFCYANQIRAKQKGIMTYDYNYKKKEGKTLSIQDKYLFHIESVQDIKDSQLTGEIFLNALAQDYIKAELVDYADGKQWLITSVFNPDLAFSFAAHGTQPSIELLLQDLYQATKTYGEDFIEFAQEIQNIVDSQHNNNVAQLQDFETVAAYKKFAKRLEGLGLTVVVDSLGKDAPNGYVQDGIIYLNTDKSVTSTAFHELMHIVLGVMKHDDYKGFEHAMELMYRSPIAKQIYTEISREGSAYENLIDLDKKEEVFCRIIELVANGRIPIEAAFVDEEGKDTYHMINKMINPFIGKTFDIAPPSFLMSFVTDTVSTLPGKNSTIFMKQKADSTGYIQEKRKSIQSTKISAWLQHQVSIGALEQTTC